MNPAMMQMMMGGGPTNDFTPPMMAYVGATAVIIIPAISNGYLLYIT